MRVDTQQRMSLLMSDLELPTGIVEEFFTDASLEKLRVQKATSTWTFHIQIARVLPQNVYQMFYSRLKSRYQQFAEVKLFLESKERPDNKLFIDYWPYIVEDLADASSAMRSHLSRVLPEYRDNKLFIPVRSEPEAGFLKNDLCGEMQLLYGAYGFPKFLCEPVVQMDQTQQEQLRNQVKQEDIEEAKRMLELQFKREQSRDDDEGPVDIRIGKPIQDEVVPIKTIQDEERRIAIRGLVFAAESRELRSGKTIFTFKLTDYTDSLVVKMFARDETDVKILSAIKKGMWIQVAGRVEFDTFLRDLCMMIAQLSEVKMELPADPWAGEKRVELHAHSQMSQMDAVMNVTKYVERAATWGHPAVAITDHAGAQSFPDAYYAGKKNDIKILYGIEANVVNDGVQVAYHPVDQELEKATFVVFDVETTGLSAMYNKIIELAAVKIYDGDIIDKFEAFADPKHLLSATTIDLTGITDEMVRGKPDPEQVVKEFMDWAGESILVAHNASFDIGFLNATLRSGSHEESVLPVIDTLELARVLMPSLKNHRLNTLAKRFDIELTQHHRAIYDAEATGYLMLKLLQMADEMFNMKTHLSLNREMGKDISRARPYHATVYAKNRTGLKNLYRLISLAHTKHVHRVVRTPRSQLVAHRDGLIIGSACDNGEVFDAALNKSDDDLAKVMRFYDFIEIQPPAMYGHLIEREIVQNELELRELIKKVIRVAEENDILPVATGNVHYLDKHDATYREVLIRTQGGANMLNMRKQLPPAHFRTTQEMMQDFKFLGPELSERLVITNSQQIADWFENIDIIPKDLFTPKIEGADEEVRTLSYNMAHQIYGEVLPEIVEARLEKELKSIIGHGFAVIYLISHKLVKKSLDDGYLVGSRGSVGSSLVATMTEITEVNPLPPHYVCPNCKESEFFDDGSVGSGFDLPDKSCKTCDIPLTKDGHDIPFETFLGFKGDKVPDIDLNFSGEYQPKAHAYTKVLFGDDYVYRAGTIGTIAEKTAYGYVKGYQSENDLTYRNAEVDRLVSGVTGVKRTTGQHPGGIIVVPDYMDIYDISPIQFPADDMGSEWKTTHFDFHSIHDNLLKLDILGHDDPTMIRMLQDLSGRDPKTIPVDDAEVMKIFSSTESIGVTPEQIDSKTGTLGIPEFGTKFVRQMLEETKPTTFSELVQISGLSHGTDVWLGNASELIYNGTCELKDVIGCRDDIMVYLIYAGLEPSLAFKIMESVRKGKGLSIEMEEAMIENNVPLWYIDSCKKIKYMFPKAHAAAYVLMAVRIAYYKVHHPMYYYASYFTVRAGDFDIGAMNKGSAAIRKVLQDIKDKGFEATAKDKGLYTVLEIALEMIERGFTFNKVDLYKSSATEFLIDGDTLLPPFDAVTGLGTNAAKQIVEARKGGEFLSKEDLQKRAKLSKTIIETLDNLGCLEGLPDENQLSLFDL
ncbi:PolC-type DNA polymerase III [Exiguobacterium antarcticum]|uniref:DNA polymerase III PolC-type n=1 Tax=Exiguobacterium antarcticum TaxID=132920 RepID=A0ABT6QYW9_9BACL|nr:PolC-type DNA polymerase III [Exiguobacterium antarcticum]MDI3233886.1 PolC-type DNA polymerase III [Exiguobacterium antarcticum]